MADQKIYMIRPKSGPAQKAWDALDAKVLELIRIYYDRKDRVWVGIGRKYMTTINYWPNCPIVRLRDLE
jgi:hypothetical protein